MCLDCQRLCLFPLDDEELAQNMQKLGAAWTFRGLTFQDNDGQQHFSSHGNVYGNFQFVPDVSDIRHKIFLVEIWKNGPEVLGCK